MVDGFAAKVAGYLVDPIVRQFSYVWNYKTNFENLETEIRKLKVKRGEVQHLVDKARRNVEEIEEDVSDWLDRVKKTTDELSEFIEKHDPEMGLCPNLKKRYQFSRKALEMVNVASGLREERQFHRVAYPRIPKQTSPKDYVSFESRKSTWDNILQALSDPDVNTIGIYGVGGIGKTMLAMEVVAHAEKENLFKVVAFVKVAVEAKIIDIQQKIADKLGLTFREGDTTERAKTLRDRLKQETKVLLVLDDIWARLDPEEVGIPLGDDHKGCKLLLTARNLRVLKNEMDSRHNFMIADLEKGEEWSLFKKKAGDCVDDRFQALAKDIVNKCGGLPIAINSLATALKNEKEECVWKDALQVLTTPSPRSFEEAVTGATYNCIEISYNLLKREDLKLIFLLCSTMRRPSIEDLLVYVMGLGFFEDVKTIEAARNKVNARLITLKESSLLLDIDSHKFSLHDVVRDVATSIASRDRHIHTMKDKVDMRDLVCKEVFKNCIWISLHDIGELVEELECPHLQFLYMRNEGNKLQIPDKFFTRMPELEVLHLVGLNLCSAPTSLRCLEKLKTLYVDYCELKDIDFVGVLKQLEILRISCFEFLKFPEKMRNLTALRLLDLACYNNFDSSPNVISTLTKLEELYLCGIDNTKRGFGLSVVHEMEYLSRLGVGISVVDELKYLSHLTALQIYIRDANVLPQGRWLTRGLEKYKIVIGASFGPVDGPFYSNGTSSSRMVKLDLYEYCHTDDVFHETPSVDKFLSGWDGVGFPDLEYLQVRHDSCFRTIVDCLDSKSRDPFRFLESLVLENMFKLEKICNGQLKTESFGRLRDIRVEGCNLKNIFTLSTYKALPSLQEVHVRSCCILENIFVLWKEEEDINTNRGVPNEIEFKQLCRMSLDCLPKLKSFCSITSNEEEMPDAPSPFFNPKVMFPNLETLELYGINFKNIWRNELPAASSCFPRLRQLHIRGCSNLKVLFSSSTAVFPSLEEIKIAGMDDMERLWPKQLCMDSLFNLKSVAVGGCNKLVTIFQSNMLERLIMNLETLSVDGCELVEEIFDLQESNYEGSHVEIETQLRELTIHGLPKLKHIWNKDPQNTFSFQKLHRVSVFNCQSLKYIFPFSLAKNLPELDWLGISYSGVEEIVADEGEANVAATFEFPQITFLMLHNLHQLKTFYRGVHTTKWLNLKELIMEGCNKVELFASELFFQGANEGQHDISLQPLFVVEKNAFRSLKKIRIKGSENLKIVWYNLAKESFCDVKSTVTHQLEELYICGLPKLKYIWKKDPRAKLSFEGLPLPKKLTIWHCASIEGIFDLQEVNFETSHSRATTYGFQEQQLVKLEVDNCEKMEEIVAKEADERQGAIFVIPKVTCISLGWLPKLRAFHSGKHPLKWSDLRELEVIDCAKIESLASALSGFQRENEQSHFEIPVREQPSFLVEKDFFPKLEVLKLRGEGVQILLQDQHAEELLCNLKFLEVCDDKSIVFPLCILQRFHHLQKLRFVNCSYKEIFSNIDNKINDGMVSQSNRVLQNLESLAVENCDNMIQLVPFSVSFRSLRCLHVLHCNGLTSLVTSSTAKSFGELREMKIICCKSMIEVVAKEGDVTEDKIIFNKLRTLTLHCLPSLSCFCSGKYTFELPSLEEFSVHECPKMKYYTSGEVTTQKLEKVIRNWKDYILDGDLNTTIQNTGRYLEQNLLEKQQALLPLAKNKSEEDEDCEVCEVNSEEEEVIGAGNRFADFRIASLWD